MTAREEIIADIGFSGPIIAWRGPAPYHFVAVPEAHVGELRHAARLASYGWGVVPVRATVGAVDFTTSLFPRDGGYLLPLKDAVRKAGGFALGDSVTVRLRVAMA